MGLKAKIPRHVRPSHTPIKRAGKKAASRMRRLKPCRSSGRSRVRSIAVWKLDKTTRRMIVNIVSRSDAINPGELADSPPVRSTDKSGSVELSWAMEYL
jgi:hypothetical protein